MGIWDVGLWDDMLWDEEGPPLVIPPGAHGLFFRDHSGPSLTFMDRSGYGFHQ